MKKTTLTLALLVLATTVFAQDFAGKRIYSGNLQLNLSANNSVFTNTGGGTSYKNLILSTNFLIGKIKGNNAYTAYGLNMSVDNQRSGTNDSKSNRYSVGPVIEFGKFVKVFDKFYFSPTIGASVSGIFGSSFDNNTLSDNTTIGIGTSINATPIRFVYQLNNSAFLNISLGSGSLFYNFTRVEERDGSIRSDTHTLNVSGNIANFTGIGVFYLF